MQFFFLHVHIREEGEIQTSNIRFIRRDLRSIKLPKRALHGTLLLNKQCAFPSAHAKVLTGQVLLISTCK